MPTGSRLAGCRPAIATDSGQRFCSRVPRKGFCQRRPSDTFRDRLCTQRSRSRCHRTCPYGTCRFAGVRAILTETGLEGRRLELELTDGVLMDHADSTASVLQELKILGVGLAIDDFGTGFSSLSYLTKFPIDALKIDQSFIRQLSTNPDETTVVAAIINMGQSLNLRVIAEGGDDSGLV